MRGDTFYVGSTEDGTIYRGELDEEVATPFLLPGNPEGRTFAVGMKVHGRTLFVAGGPTGKVFAYDLRSGRLVGQWSVPNPPDPASPEDPATATFLNDIAISDDGDVYVTDSLRPFLYRIDDDDRRTRGVETLETFLGFDGTPLVYQGPPNPFNVNGIAVSRDDRYLVVAQSNTGTLFRIGIQDRSVTPVELAEPVAGDGLVLDGRTLYVVERRGDVGNVVQIRLDRRLTEGTIQRRLTDPTFVDPTTAALVGRSLLVVNSQFGARPPEGSPTPPFTVSRVRLPHGH